MENSSAKGTTTPAFTVLTPKDHIMAKVEEHGDGLQALYMSNAKIRMLEVQLESEKRLRDKIWAKIGQAAFHWGKPYRTPWEYGQPLDYNQ